MEYRHGMLCPACVKGRLMITLDPLEFSYRGNEQILEGFESFRCDVCPESFLSKEHSLEVELILKVLREVLDNKSEDDPKVTWTVTRMEADSVKSN